SPNWTVPTRPSGTSDNSAASTAFVVSQIGVGPYGLALNMCGRNGGLEVWQRGTSVSVAASTTAYTADGWYLKTGANQACTVSRQTGLTGNSIYCARVQRNSGQTGTGVLTFGFPLDTDECIKAVSQKLVLQFTVAFGANWSPSSGTLTYNVYFGTATPTKQTNGYSGQTN